MALRKVALFDETLLTTKITKVTKILIFVTHYYVFFAFFAVEIAFVYLRSRVMRD